MINLVPRPYKLFNKIQNYEWGTRDGDAFIPKFLGWKAQPDIPYAELWIGAHPSAPSEIELDGQRHPLDKVIELHRHESLGDYVSAKFSGRLPFLLKILSAAHALSIQTHPDKEQAVKLHALRPEHYPDDNQKPEIAIALDRLNALVGFKPARKISETIRGVPEIGGFADRQIYGSAVSSGSALGLEEAVKKLYADIMRRGDRKEELSVCIGKIRERLSRKQSRSPEELQFLRQYEFYGNDIGLLSFFFLNMVQLKAGQAIFTRAGMPHTYIEGNIVECMANSDNVVRAGLTDKFKDVETLLDILKYEFAACEIINSEKKQDEAVYDAGAEEFRLIRLHKGGGFKKVCKSNDRPSVCFITDGAAEIVWKHAGVDYLKSFSKGDSFFIPAFLSEYRISSASGVDYFSVEIP